jgi:uncharacterized membrane protein YfcA
VKSCLSAAHEQYFKSISIHNQPHINCYQFLKRDCYLLLPNMKYASAILIILIVSAVSFTSADILGKTCNEINQVEECGRFACYQITNDTVTTCQICRTTKDCQNGNDAFYRACLPTGDLKRHPHEMECRTKKLFEPFTVWDGLSSFLVFLGGAVASGAGIGGGGVYVPLFILFGWGKGAVERSLGATTGLSIAMMIMIAPRRHPEVNRPLIDYKTMLLLEPIVLLGTVPGKNLNKVFPTLLLYILLLLLLIVICIRTWQKYFRFARQQKEKEEALKAAASKDKPLSADQQQRVLDSKKSLYLDTMPGPSALDEVEIIDTIAESIQSQRQRKKTLAEKLTDMVEEETKQPWKTIGALILCWSVILIIASIIRFGLTCGTAEYIAVNVVYIPSLVIFTILAAVMLNKEYLRKVEFGYKFADGDLLYTKRNTMVWPSLFFISGLLASLLGIGGGMVIGPLLLEIGLNPVVSNATTACMTLFTASAATLQYLVTNQDSFDYFLWYLMITFCAGLVGRKFIQGYLKRTGKQAVVVALLGGVITVSLVMMSIVTVSRIKGDIDANIPFMFLKLC